MNSVNYDQIVHDAWHVFGDFTSAPNQTQIETMLKEANEERTEMVKKSQKIKTTLFLGILSAGAGLFIIFTSIYVNMLDSPQFILSVIFVSLVLYHMFTLITAQRVISRHRAEQEFIIRMVSPSTDKYLLEKIYAFSQKNRALARYLEDTRGRMLTVTEVSAIDALRKKF